jgi:hypothetical protein
MTRLQWVVGKWATLLASGMARLDGFEVQMEPGDVPRQDSSDSTA